MTTPQITRRTTDSGRPQRTRTIRGGVIACMMSLVALSLWSGVAGAAPNDPNDPGSVQQDPVSSPELHPELVTPVPALSGDIVPNCLDDDSAGMLVLITNHSSVPQNLHASAVEIPVYSNTIETFNVTVPANVTTGYQFGTWDNGSTVSTGMMDADDNLLFQQDYTVNCGPPQLEASSQPMCLFPGGLHIIVNVSNVGSTPATVQAEIQSTDPADPFMAPQVHDVQPGDDYEFDFGVEHGKTYSVQASFAGQYGASGGPLLDDEITIDCEIIDDSVTPPTPESGAGSSGQQTTGTAGPLTVDDQTGLDQTSPLPTAESVVEDSPVEAVGASSTERILASPVSHGESNTKTKPVGMLLVLTGAAILIGALGTHLVFQRR